jgi:phi13 family phage major tail protein
MPQSGEYKSKIGLDSLYIAVLTQDDASGYVAGTPVWFAPAAEASQAPVTAIDMQYADNQPYDVLTAEAETKITLKVTNLDLATLALITGRVFDVASGRMYDNGGIPPDCALLCRAKKSNGKYRYYSFLHGKFSMPKEDVATQAAKPDPKQLELEFTAIRTVYKFVMGAVTDSVKRLIGDDDTVNFVAGSTWFTQVQTPTTTVPSALSMTASVPANSASAVVITQVCTLTFNNALQVGEEFDCMIINSTTGAVIAGVNTIDGTRKIVTVAHTASLAAATLHRMIYTVKDVFGQVVVGTTSFTTA